MSAAARIRALRASEIDGAAPPEIAACGAQLARLFGEGVCAVLFYGGGLRTGLATAPLDFYVLVEGWAAVSPIAWQRWACRLLPPNVYAVDVNTPAGPRACKVAVMPLAAFAKGMRATAPQLWARFAQGVTLAFARTDAARDAVGDALAAAVTTAIGAALPLMPARFTADALWRRIFVETYRAELRPEAGGDRADALVAAAAGRYRALTEAALGPADADDTFANPSPAGGAWRWTLRRRWGRLLNALRLMKAAFTYAGGLDYAVAKIARHTGVAVAVTEADRRRPLLGGIRIFLEARRRGGVR